MTGLHIAMRVIATALLTALIVSVVPLTSSAGLTVLAIGAGVAAVLAWQLPLLRAPLLSAFLIRAFLSLFKVFVAPLPGSGGDEIRFDRVAWEWASESSTQWLAHFGGGADLYVWLMSAGYRIAGRSELLVLSVNVAFSALIVWHTYQLAVELGARSRARWAAWWTALFPTLALYSSVMLREVAVAYPFVLGALFFVRWRITRSTLWFTATLGAFLASAAFHTGSVIPLAVTAAIFAWDWVGAITQGRFSRILKGTVALGVVAVIGLVVLRTGVGMDKLSLVRDFSPEAFGDYQEVAARSRAAYLSSLTIGSPLDIAWQLPIRMAYYLFSPFPWMVRSVGDVIGLLDAVLYLVLAWTIWKGRARIRSSVAARGVAGLTLATIVVFSLATSNYGTAIRHRAKTAPMLIALAALASARPPKREEAAAWIR